MSNVRRNQATMVDPTKAYIEDTSSSVIFLIVENTCMDKNYYVRVQHPWIHGACHWPNEDPWRYCDHFSRLNESASIKWLAKQNIIMYQRVASLEIAKGSRHACDKGKRKVADNTEAKQSCKFKEDPLVLRVALDIKAKR